LILFYYFILFYFRFVSTKKSHMIESGVSCCTFGSGSRYFGTGTNSGRMRIFSCDFPSTANEQQTNDLPRIRSEIDTQVC
jgi:hypothetical protein